MIIVTKYKHLNEGYRRSELPSSEPSLTKPGQSFTVEELLRRSQNGTFPDINFYESYDHEGDLPDDASKVRFDEEHDFVTHLDRGAAQEEFEKVSAEVQAVLQKQKNNKYKSKKSK